VQDSNLEFEDQSLQSCGSTVTSNESEVACIAEEFNAKDAISEGETVLQDADLETNEGYVFVESSCFNSTCEVTSGEHSREETVKFPKRPARPVLNVLTSNEEQYHFQSKLESDKEKKEVTNCEGDDFITTGNIIDKSSKFKRMPKPKPRRPPPPCPLTRPQVQISAKENSNGNDKNLIDHQAKLSDDILPDYPSGSLFKPLHDNISEEEHKNESMLEELEQNKFHRVRCKQLEKDALNSLVHEKVRKPYPGVHNLKGDLGDDKQDQDIVDGASKIPFIQEQTRANNKQSKGDRWSCPAPHVPFEQKNEIDSKIEHKWKLRSLTDNSQDPQNLESKSELQKRFQELRKRSEESPDVVKHTANKKLLSTVKDEIDEEMEDAVFFDYVLVVKLREEENGLEPYISFRFPPKQQYDKELDPRVASIPQFCFPDLKNRMNTADYIEHHIGFSSSETFSFVLTDMVGKRHFGYCRQIQAKKSFKKA